MHRFRERLLWVALATTLIAVIALLWAATYAPSESANHWTFSITWYSVITTVLATLLSVGLVSLIIELFLRQSYAKSLRRYLNLKTSLVKSGLFEAASESEFSFATILSGGSIIEAVIRDPQRWALRNFEAVLAAAKHRATRITLLWPDPDDSQFEALAASLDYEPEALKKSMELALELVKKSWQSASVLEGSTITVSGIPNPQYELLRVDDTVICSLGRAFDPHQGEAQFALGFEAHAYPVQWFISQLADGRRGGEMWAAVGSSGSGNKGRS